MVALRALAPAAPTRDSGGQWAPTNQNWAGGVHCPLSRYFDGVVGAAHRGNEGTDVGVGVAAPRMNHMGYTVLSPAVTPL